jgi:hypothetical protein
VKAVPTAAPTAAPTAVSTAQPTAELLDEFWCSDCLSRSLFERVVDAADGSEWACTACGAAYFDAIDLTMNARREDRHTA